MVPIATQFDDRLFRWRQLERHGDLAIYEQQHKASGHCYYEVIKIRVQREHTWPDGRTTPEREAYPGASTWGTLGFTCWSLSEAQALLTTLQQASSSEDEEPAADPPEGLDATE